jgi:hypothetical protein
MRSLLFHKINIGNDLPRPHLHASSTFYSCVLTKAFVIFSFSACILCSCGPHVNERDPDLGDTVPAASAQSNPYDHSKAVLDTELNDTAFAFFSSDTQKDRFTVHVQEARSPKPMLSSG